MTNHFKEKSNLFTLKKERHTLPSGLKTEVLSPSPPIDLSSVRETAIYFQSDLSGSDQKQGLIDLHAHVARHLGRQ